VLESIVQKAVVLPAVTHLSHFIEKLVDNFRKDEKFVV